MSRLGEGIQSRQFINMNRYFYNSYTTGCSSMRRLSSASYFALAVQLAIVMAQDVTSPLGVPANSDAAMDSEAFESALGPDPEGKIINGTFAAAEDVAHHVSLRYKMAERLFFGRGHVCGGSLISPNVALTAAHCFVDYRYSKCKERAVFMDAFQFMVVMGNLNRFNRTNTFAFDVVNITVVHKTFNLTSFQYDIALAFLNGSVPPRAGHIRPIELNRQPVESGTICQVTGWGITENNTMTDKLRTLDVPAIPGPMCAKLTAYGNKIQVGMMCAGFIIDGGKDACQGDSGGPLVCGRLLAGIVSWGFGCAGSFKPGVYTVVDYYQEWIEKEVKQFRDVTTCNCPKGKQSGSNHLCDHHLCIVTGFLLIMPRRLCEIVLFSKIHRK